jgi:DNA modification methylase
MEYRKLSELKKLANNPRTISDKDMDILKKSIKDNPDYFAARPLILSDRTGDFVILGGNQRYEASKALGLKEVPTHLIEGLSAKREREIVVRDNVNNGQWNWDELSNWGEDLDSWGVDTTEHKPEDAEVEEDEAPDVSAEPPVSKLGEIYQLGKHRVMCGDSTDKANVELLMNGDKADMVFTDPPYGMNLDTDFSGMKSKMFKGKTGGADYTKVIGDNEQYDPTHLLDLAPEVITWGADYYADKLPKGGSWYVWDKRLDESADKMWGSGFELAWSKVPHKRDLVRVKWAGIFGMEKSDTKTRVHPTQKPVELVAWFFERIKGNNILDLFLGSGSTLIACEQTDRICYGMELDPKYVDVIRKRFVKYVYGEEALEDNKWIDLTSTSEQ